MSHPLEDVTGPDDRAGDPVVEYLETIALLQDEVARLEQELRCRDQGPSEAPSAGAAPDRDGIDPEPAVGAAVARAEVQRLEAELAGREETIGLLLDQLGRVEEAQAASRAEWEQLAGWLDELEQRVEGRAAPGLGPDPAAIDALRSENLRLRAALQELAERGASAPSEPRDDRLAELQRECDALRRQLEQIRDERRREQLEHGAIVAELQAQLSRASLARPEPPPQAPSEAEAASRARDEQLRFQALRQHLLDIHNQEEEEQRQKQLIPRLSRLWRRTGPR